MTSARHSAGSVPGAGGPGKSGGKWGDLSRRVASTLVLLGIGVMLAVAQGPWLRLGMAVISAITFWELAAMTGWRNPARHVTLFGRSRPIALAANLQLDAVCYNAFIQEQSLGIHYNQGSDLLDYLTDPSVFAYDDGFVAIPQGPGLGIEVNEDKVRQMAAEGHRWRNPVWRHADGSFAEW